MPISPTPTLGNIDLNCFQGGTFNIPLTFTDDAGNPLDFTGKTAEMRVKEQPLDTTSVVELTTANGRITLGGTNGIAILEIAAADTGILPIGSYRYDFAIVDGTTYTYYLEGAFNVKDMNTTP